MPQDIEEIVIRFIPQADQRYDTVGDWLFEGRRLVILVSRMGNEVYQQAVAVHELIEALLCNAAGVTQEAVDRFDMVGLGKDSDEPGFEPTAPYHREHCWADVVERTFIAAAGKSWAKYDQAVGDHGCEC
jgi:hypothetical protein